MPELIDLTNTTIDEFREKIKSLSLLDKYVIALKFKKKRWSNPFFTPTRMSEEELYYLEQYSEQYGDEFEESMENQTKVPPKKTQKFINPLEQLNMFWHEDTYKLLTSSTYENSFAGSFSKDESEVLKLLLGSVIGYQLFYGKRYFLFENVTHPNRELIDEINRRWDCFESEKIQEWYYQNNSEYRSEIDRAGGNKTITETQHYYECYLSNLTQEETKNFVAIHISRESNLPERQYFISYEHDTDSRRSVSKSNNPETSKPLVSNPARYDEEDYELSIEERMYREEQAMEKELKRETEQDTETIYDRMPY